MAVLVMGILLTGCHTMPLSKENRSHITKISIDPNVPIPKTITFQGNGDQVGRVFGILGQGITDSINKKNADTMNQFVKSHNINIGTIFIIKLKEEINKSRSFQIVSTKNKPDATLRAAVIGYGLHPAYMGLSVNTMGPVLFVRVKLEKDNKIIWETDEIVLPVNVNTPNKTMNELLSNPKVLSDMLGEASKEMAKKIIQRMLG